MKKGNETKSKGEAKGDTEKKRKMALGGGGGKQVFLLKKKATTTKRNKTKQTKKDKEGLGPSEVALWATSPDP